MNNLKQQEILVLLGVEGCVESEETPGIRGFEHYNEPGCTYDFDEVIEVFCRQQNITRSRYGECLVDHNGRPYLLRAIDPDVAPEEIVSRARKYARMVRLLP